MKWLLALILMAVIVPAISLAGETDWVEVMPGVLIRLVSADTLNDDGTVWMGIEIDMADDTKTYWRVPGESGIPLEIDTGAARGIGAVDLAWPYPLREITDAYLDHAYYGRTLIPFAVEVTGPDARFVGEITLGICSDVCVPVSLRLALPVRTDAPDTANGLRIRQALATVPLPYDAPDGFGAAAFDPDRKVLRVAFGASDIDPATIIAEIEGTMLVFDAPVVATDGEALEFALLGRFEPQWFADARARFTFDSPHGPFEVTRALGND